MKYLKIYETYVVDEYLFKNDSIKIIRNHNKQICLIIKKEPFPNETVTDIVKICLKINNEFNDILDDEKVKKIKIYYEDTQQIYPYMIFDIFEQYLLNLEKDKKNDVFVEWITKILATVEDESEFIFEEVNPIFYPILFKIIKETSSLVVLSKKLIIFQKDFAEKIPELLKKML